MISSALTDVRTDITRNKFKFYNKPKHCYITLKTSIYNKIDYLPRIITKYKIMKLNFVNSQLHEYVNMEI
jgi:hypothetical protein